MREHLRKMHQGLNAAAVVPPTCSNAVASTQMEATTSPTLNVVGMGIFNAVERGIIGQAKTPTFPPNNVAAPEAYSVLAPGLPDLGLGSLFAGVELNGNFNTPVENIEGLDLGANMGIPMGYIDGLELDFNLDIPIDMEG